MEDGKGGRNLAADQQEEEVPASNGNPPAASKDGARRGRSNSFDVNTFLKKALLDYAAAGPSHHPADTCAPLGGEGEARRKHWWEPLGRRPPREMERESTPAPAGRPVVVEKAEREEETVGLLEEERGEEAASEKVEVSTPRDAAITVLSSSEEPVRSSQSQTSLSSQSSARALCRICHLPAEPGDPLITPCRCAGTMQHVHTSCLVHWLEISTKKMCPSPQCELCGYQYKTYHCLRIQRPHLPRCSHTDKVLHLVFILVMLVMAGCAVLSVLYLKQEPYKRGESGLSGDDVVVITCSILFFCSFFVAVFTQYRAEASLCRLVFRCWLINEHWRIKNYEKTEDPDWVLAHPQEGDPPPDHV